MFLRVFFFVFICTLFRGIFFFGSYTAMIVRSMLSLNFIAYARAQYFESYCDSWSRLSSFFDILRCLIIICKWWDGRVTSRAYVRAVWTRHELRYKYYNAYIDSTNKNIEYNRTYLFTYLFIYLSMTSDIRDIKIITDNHVRRGIDIIPDEIICYLLYK